MITAISRGSDHAHQLHRRPLSQRDDPHRCPMVHSRSLEDVKPGSNDARMSPSRRSYYHEPSGHYIPSAARGEIPLAPASGMAPLATWRPLRPSKAKGCISPASSRRWGKPVDCLLTATRARKIRKRFFTQATRRKSTPEKITIDQKGAHAAAILSSHAALGPALHSRR